MPRLLAIDPGTLQSAWVTYVPQTRQILAHGLTQNDELVEMVRGWKHSKGEDDHLAIEMVASYGMAVGKTVFETCVWIGRFIEAWGSGWTMVYRAQVKSALCRSQKATDSNIRQRLLDLLGPQGSKKAPGPTYGISKDVWSALAIALTHAGHADPSAGLPHQQVG